MLASDQDVAFYQLIHQLQVEPRGLGGERRQSERHTFRLVQRIAPLTGPGLPSPAAFFPVTCSDLARQGFSFLLPHEPEFARLAVALGQPGEEIFVAAQVRNCRTVAGSGVDRPMVLVGCEFLHRLR